MYAHPLPLPSSRWPQDRKVDKARSWFNRAVTLNPDVGDFWAAYFRFEGQHGTPESQAEVVRR